MSSREYSERFRRRFLMILVISWMIPIQLDFAGQRMDPYRLLLVLSLIPFGIGIWTGRAGRLIAVDWLVAAFGGWMILTFVLHHGMSVFSFSVSLAIEAVGGYFVGRVTVRSTDDLRAYISYFLLALLFMAPFAVIELVRGNSPILDFFGRFFPTIEKEVVWRHGLARVQTIFPHPILFGLFCAMHLALVLAMFRGKLSRLLPRLGLMTLMSVASLSSAPMLSIAMQAFTVAWGFFTGHRWKLLVTLVVGVIVFLEFASNRGPAIILIETLTLDPSTGWYRYFIWVNVIENIKMSPLTGIGMNDWIRPSWMFSGSVDSYWLVISLRHGLPELLLLAGAFSLHLRQLIRVGDLEPEARAIRDGYVISFVGICFILTTVHIWGVASVAVMFFLGAGSFLYTSGSAKPALPNDNAEAPALPDQIVQGRKQPVYARTFPRHERIVTQTRFKK